MGICPAGRHRPQRPQRMAGSLRILAIRREGVSLSDRSLNALSVQVGGLGPALKSTSSFRAKRRISLLSRRLVTECLSLRGRDGRDVVDRCMIREKTYAHVPRSPRVPEK